MLSRVRARARGKRAPPSVDLLSDDPHTIGRCQQWADLLLHENPPSRHADEAESRPGRFIPFEVNAQHAAAASGGAAIESDPGHVGTGGPEYTQWAL